MLQREQQELILNKKDAVIAEYVKKGGGWRQSSKYY
jgi:hypothetical protein